MTRRNIELMLLLIASPIVIVLFAMMVVTGGQELSFNTLGVPLGIFAAFLVAHIAVRLLAPAADPAILPISFALSGVGIAFVTRIVPDLAVNQLLWLFIGIAAMIATLAVVRNLDKLANYKYTLMIVGILLLLSPMLPVIGYESGGGQLWLRFGSFSFQPASWRRFSSCSSSPPHLAANREMLSVFTWKVGPLWLPSSPPFCPSSSCGRSPSSSSCWRKTSASPWCCFPCSSSCCMWPRGRSSTWWCPLGLRPLRPWPFTA